MKTPDEIKNGLEQCHAGECAGCTYYIKIDSPFGDEMGCYDNLLPDALAYIKQLEAENVRLKRELGSAVMALATCATDGLDGNICKYCTHKYCDEMDLHYECFEWRGVCEENSGKEAEQHDY